jgi:hypothetical protein
MYPSLRARATVPPGLLDAPGLLNALGLLVAPRHAGFVAALHALLVYVGLLHARAHAPPGLVVFTEAPPRLLHPSIFAAVYALLFGGL